MTSSALELPTIDAPPAERNIVKFHLSLNVANLDQSVAFFRVLFGREAAKCRPDYAKFELDEPPVVLSLEPHAPGSFGALNHLGFRLTGSTELVEWQRRLEMAGIATQREEGVECCYARQTKFWVRDPDNNLWEIYVLEEDIEHRGAGQAPVELPPAVAHSASSGTALLDKPAVAPSKTPVALGQPAVASTPPAKAIWQHQLGTPLPARIFAHDGSAAEVHLRGSFNTAHAPELRRQLLQEVFRILEPSGTVSLHVLTAERGLDVDFGTLPGPAAYVTHVPARQELLTDLVAAGFQGVQLTKFGSTPCFSHAGAELRETMITAMKPARRDRAESREVVYLGPFDSVHDDEGTLYPRGKRVTVPLAKWQCLSTGSLANQFTCLEPNGRSSDLPNK